VINDYGTREKKLLKEHHPSSQTRRYWQRTRHRRTISVSFRSFYPAHVSVRVRRIGFAQGFVAAINLFFLIESGCGLSSGCKEARMTLQIRFLAELLFPNI
jgi:hypothetical protein